MRTASLIEKGQTGDRDAITKALDGHLCRCTGDGRIVDAIQTAGEACANGGQIPPEPRRNQYFGEQFGLSRNPVNVPVNGSGHARANGNSGSSDGEAHGNGHSSNGKGPGGKGQGVGQSIRRQGGIEQTLGQKPFVDDMRAPGMLHGAMVLTEHPRARILKIHREDAEAMPGVARIFTAADVPGRRGTGINDPDQPIFVAEGELTCCVADFLAMVVADTQFHARAAAKAIKIDYEVLEPITDPLEALKPDAPLVHSTDTYAPRPSNILQPVTAFARGDVDAALATAAHVITATFQTQPIEIAFLEPEACLAVPHENNGRPGVIVHTDSQGSMYDHAQITKVLNLEPDDVEIALAASGGAFGAKEELSIQAQTALAAFLLQRPVKTVLTREQSTQHHVKRHAMTLTSTLGADADGHLLAMRTRIISDAGGYHTTSAKCSLRAACHAAGVYRIPTSTSTRKLSIRTIPTLAPCADSAPTRRSSRWRG